MGRVKELWQQEREDRYNRLVAGYIDDGYSVDDASAMAQTDMDEEDEANGQFGAGA